MAVPAVMWATFRSGLFCVLGGVESDPVRSVAGPCRPAVVNSEQLARCV